MGTVLISDSSLSWRTFDCLFDGTAHFRLSREAKKSILASHQLLNDIIDTGDQIYGVNTGFGKLSNISIKTEDLKQLQLNLVKSHACGVGKPLGLGVTRITMVLKLMTWAKGYSGISPKLSQLLLDMLNHDILPVIPRKGSVGASGDLAPLAHMACAMIGEGDVFFQDRITSARNALRKSGLKPIVLGPKEGLSLLNGTHVSTALAIRSLSESKKLLTLADISGALSTEASLSSMMPFDPKIHKLKKHKGQLNAATNVFRLLKSSEIVKSHQNCDRVQDPYSIRCLPHVHGSSREIFTNVEKIIDNELNSVSDNPLIFPNGKVMNSGHFHAEPVAQAIDSLSIAMAEIGAIAERRIHFLMKGVDGKVPLFGAKEPGIESGFMLAQVTAAALASENKTLAHPASIDSLSTSAGQEDFVSMAPWSAISCLQILKNVRRILAIELLVATNINYRFHKKYSSGSGLKPVITLFKREKLLTKNDHVLSQDLVLINKLITSGKIIQNVKKVINLV